MEGNWITLTVGLVGIIGTFFFSRHYFQRSLDKSLTPYIVFSSSPLRGIDSVVRKALEIKYQEHFIETLYEIEFLIANTGEKAIRDVIEPLSLEIPDGATLLDASLLHVAPEGRTVNLEISQNKKNVFFDFPVLNKKDFFIAKLLLNGEVKEKDFKFQIVADDLPPFLLPQFLPFDSVSIDSKLKTEFNGVTFTGGLFITCLGISTSSLIYISRHIIPNFDNNIIQTISSMGFAQAVLLLSAIPAGIFILLGIMVATSAFTGGSFPPQKKLFILPDDKASLIRPHRHFPKRLDSPQEGVTNNT